MVFGMTGQEGRPVYAGTEILMELIKTIKDEAVRDLGTANCCNRVTSKFLFNGQVVNILGFASHMVYVTTTLPL